MSAMTAPGTDDLIGPERRRDNGVVVCRADRIAFGAHHLWIGGAKGKDIGHAKRPEPKGAGAAFTALDRRIVLELRRSGGIQHHEGRLGAAGLPDPRQGITIVHARRIDRLGRGIAFLELANDKVSHRGRKRG